MTMICEKIAKKSQHAQQAVLPHLVQVVSACKAGQHTMQPHKYHSMMMASHLTAI